MGKGIVDELKRQYSIEEQWLPFEIHPETPPEGALLTEHLPHIDWDDLYERLRQSGERFGISFGPVSVLANSGKALQAGEYAREAGSFDAFNENMFHAYFTQCRDIGQDEVLRDIARESGLDDADMISAVAEDRYRGRLEAVTAEARRLGISSAPTFVIDDRYAVVGAQPLEVFKETLEQAAEGG